MKPVVEEAKHKQLKQSSTKSCLKKNNKKQKKPIKAEREFTTKSNSGDVGRWVQIVKGVMPKKDSQIQQQQ